ncbi:tRNA-uridine aminocarboxypropyltransferase 1 [Chanos chanos]|uniref:tRNA-uridine aminocarboxypropyltransferase 1 n=1 Tax=Chanos chanos TaxID=29144 RepID=A0A6J2UT60_CHACN|nr:DTW domain-containing protein 1 [Chanos chanos]
MKSCKPEEDETAESPAKFSEVPGKSTVECEPSDQPLEGLTLASHEVLEKAQLTGRLKCPKCGGSRMFYCYTCFSLVGLCENQVPVLKLPVKIDIIKHPNETDGKSTAVHAKLIAPDDVSIYTYPCIPELEESAHDVVLVFPGPESITVQEMAKRFQEDSDAHAPSGKRQKTADGKATAGAHAGTRAPQRVIFIDSTWNQTNRIISDERLQALTQVELKTRKTCFWRHQKGSPDTYLATIEAIYYFLRDYHVHCLCKDYHGEYDNLLFFFSYLHKLIHKAKVSAGKL